MWESLIGWQEMVIRVLMMMRNPHQLALPLPPTTYQLANILPCLIPTFMMVHRSSSFPAMLPGRPLVCGIITTSHVPMPIVQSPTPLVLRLAKLIFFHLMETDWLYHRSAWWWSMAMFVRGGLMALVRSGGKMTHWPIITIWMPYGGSWSELGSRVVCWFQLIWGTLSFGSC